MQFINQLRFVVVKRSFALFPLAQKQFGDCRVYPCAYKLLAKSSKSNAIKSVQFRTHKTCYRDAALSAKELDTPYTLRSVLRKGQYFARSSTKLCTIYPCLRESLRVY